MKLRKVKTTKKNVDRNAKELAQSLGLYPSVAIEWELRLKVQEQIVRNIDSLDLKISHIAKLSQTSRARVTQIMRGSSSGISLDVLLRILGATGQKIQVKFLKAG